ncbi:MAG: hypothetical protein KDB22_14870 [Planctomycetales bacterium]|nr:hypothetical protein [Planctomycetales bacterium]
MNIQQPHSFARIERKLADCEIALSGRGISIVDLATGARAEYPASLGLCFTDAYLPLPTVQDSRTQIASFSAPNGNWTEQELSHSSAAGTLRLWDAPQQANSAHFHLDLTVEEGAWGNALFLFDYQSQDSFKYVGGRIGANYWTIGCYQDGGFKDLTRCPESIPCDTCLGLDIVIENDAVMLFFNGQLKVRHEFLSCFCGSTFGTLHNSSAIHLAELRQCQWVGASADHQTGRRTGPGGRTAATSDKQQTRANQQPAGRRPLPGRQNSLVAKVDSTAAAMDQSSASSKSCATHLNSEIWSDELPSMPTFELLEISERRKSELKSRAKAKSHSDDLEIFTD